MSKKRDELQSVATETVQRSGFNSLSFRTLADQVGIKSSSVHYYFPEKADLANSLIANYSEQFAERLKQIDEKKTGLKNKLDALLNIFEEVLTAEKFCLCGMMAAEVDRLDATNRQLLVGYFQHLESWLVQTIDAHQEQLVFNWKPVELARMLLAGLEGAILIDRVTSTKDCLRAQRAFIRSLVQQ